MLPEEVDEYEIKRRAKRMWEESGPFKPYHGVFQGTENKPSAQMLACVGTPDGRVIPTASMRIW